MNNNERFNAMLNGCQNHRAVFNVLQSIVPVQRETPDAITRELLTTIMEPTEDEAVELLAQRKQSRKGETA